MEKLDKAERYLNTVVALKNEVKATKFRSLSHKLTLEAMVKVLEELQLRLLNIDEDYDTETENNHADA